jgi:predicted flap endonuclease-1-like 5' DNA nuclease
LKIIDIEGIGPAFAEKLQAAGCQTTDDLLRAGATKAGRASLAAQTGINEGMILEWVNAADLMRINGVGSEFSDLLEAAGVDSPAELAQRNAANLAQTFGELDMARNTTRRIPSEKEVAGWIDQAKKLDKVVEH